MAYTKESSQTPPPEDSSRTGCIFCDKPNSPRPEEEFIVHNGDLAFVMMNLYPYNTGHLLIAPYQHIARYDQLPLDALTEMGTLGQKAILAIDAALQPHGYNMGLNLGSAAGAGIASHLHMHVVPRWDGDANFMPVIGDIKVIPESLQVTYRKIVEAWNE